MCTGLAKSPCVRECVQVFLIYGQVSFVHEHVEHVSFVYEHVSFVHEHVSFVYEYVSFVRGRVLCENRFLLSMNKSSKVAMCVRECVQVFLVYGHVSFVHEHDSFVYEHVSFV